MYNRYIPQSDGTYQRSRVPDPVQQEIPEPAERAAPKPEPPKGPPSAPKRSNSVNTAMQHRSAPPITHDAGSIGSFLKGLLPQNFDTEDLIVVLLLLLMSGNSSNDQNAALLTLGIYLFM